MRLNKCHRTAITERTETNEISCMITLVFCLNACFWLQFRERKPSSILTKLRIQRSELQAIEVAGIFRAGYQRKDISVKKEVQKSLYDLPWIFGWIPRWTYANWLSKRTHSDTKRYTSAREPWAEQLLQIAQSRCLLPISQCGEASFNMRGSKGATLK